MDAISLLTQDHREVSKLFEAFEKEDADKAEIATQVCRMLTVHAMVEEELFYPAAREALADEGEDLLDEAEVEHASAKNLIAQIEAEGQDGDLFEAKVKVLGEYIRHHVKEEEGELFPKVKKADIDLNALGEELENRKATLLSEFDGSKPPKRAAKPKAKASHAR
jgi:hemerythrin superfamily protein